MESTIPAVLARLAQSGVSVRWRDGKAVFRAAVEPPADSVALINARKADVSAFLHPDAVRRRLEAQAEVLRAGRPPDIGDDRWETAMKGQRSFIEHGHADEALRLGWPHNELFAVPPSWSRVDLCGAALLIGDGEVISVTSSRIGIQTPNGSEQGFYRKPTVDYALVVRERLKQLGLDAGKEEFRLRAVEHAVNVCRANTGLDLESAKKLVLAAISTTETKTP
jgi:hypothetical protein